MKNKFIKTLIIILIILLFFSFAGYYFKKSKSNAYDIFKLFLNNIYEKISNQYDYDSDTISGNIKFKSSSLDYFFESSQIDLLMDISYDLNFNIDYKNKVALFNSISSYKNGENINIKKYYNNNGEYTYINNILDTYVKTTLTNEEFNNIFNSLRLKKDYLNIIKGLKNSIVCEDNSIYFEQLDKSQKVEINNKNYNVYINTLYINKNNYLKILENINNNLIKNKEFNNSYKNIFKKDYSIKDYNDIVDYLKKGETKIIIYNDIFTGKILKVSVEKVYEKNVSISELYINNNSYYIKTQIDKKDIEIKADILNNKGTIKVTLPNYNNGKDSTIDISYSLDYKKEIKAEDVTNSVNIQDITSEKYISVYKAIMNREELLNLYKLYESYKLSKNPNYISQSMDFIW